MLALKGSHLVPLVKLELTLRFRTQSTLIAVTMLIILKIDRVIDVLVLRYLLLEGLQALSRIVQAPEALTIYYEDGHRGGAFRTVYLDGRPHLPQQIRQWLGDSVGHWEGDTLVVDTTNFTAKTDFQGSRENLHLVERFKRVASDLIMYEVTIEDPTVWTQPWTVEIPLTEIDNKANQIFEAACHEGNYAMTSILAGARSQDTDGR